VRRGPALVAILAVAFTLAIGIQLVPILADGVEDLVVFATWVLAMIVSALVSFMLARAAVRRDEAAVARVARSLPWIAASFATVAAVAFVVQGGFGAGHGPLDTVLYVAGLPFMALLTASDGLLPDPLWRTGDFLPIVVVPGVLNVALFALVRAFLLAGARGQSKRVAD
jgi:hypothetical protein